MKLYQLKRLLENLEDENLKIKVVVSQDLREYYDINDVQYSEKRNCYMIYTKNE